MTPELGLAILVSLIFVLLSTPLSRKLWEMYDRREKRKHDEWMQRTGGYPQVRDYQHWLEFQRQVEQVNRDIAEPLGMKLSGSSTSAGVGQYTVYLWGGSVGFRVFPESLHVSVYDPETGARNLADAITYLLTMEDT